MIKAWERVADRCRGDDECGRGPPETQRPRRGIEGAQLNEGRQLVHVWIVDENGSPWAELFEFAHRPAGAEKDIGPNEESPHDLSSIGCRRRR